jgi:hypothetical protein
MTPADITMLRLRQLQITTHQFTSPGDLMRYLGAMQAQDYQAALWAIGARLPGITRHDVEQAIVDRQIVRTWPMRGTLHFVPAEDAKWMVQLMAPRIVSSQAARRRQLNITDELVTECGILITNILRGNKILTRKALLAELEKQDITTANQRGIHILWELAQRGVLCFGPYEDKQPTFVLLDEWVPHSIALEGQVAIQEMVRRYFISHGPATIKDFVAWTRLTVTDTKAALASLSAELTTVQVEGTEYWLARNHEQPIVTSCDVHLLPGYDEYMLGYRDRSAMLEAAHAQKVVPGGNGVFLPIIVIDGQIRGIWKRITTTRKTTITLLPFSTMTTKELAATEQAAQRYAGFIKQPTEVRLAS